MTALLHVVAIVVLIALAILIVAFYLFIGFAFYHFRKIHPLYYHKLGSPSFIGIDSSGMYSIKQLLLGQKYLYSWLLFGLPKSLPKDKTCKSLSRLSQPLRRVMLPFYVLLLACLAVLALAHAQF
jgi:hypothetical protein